MEIHDLITLLQYEVQKCFDFVDATKGPKDTDASVLHIALEKVEVELPITLCSKDVVYVPQQYRGIPTLVRRLKLPYSELTAIDKNYLPRTKTIAGKSIEVEVIGPTENIDDKVSPELIGRIKVVMKPVIK